jgi:hypothetical protein
MAGPAHRGSREREGSPRGASSSRPRAVVSAAGSGSTAISPATIRPDDPARRASDLLVTRTTYRLLLARGLKPEEAADLTAFLCGIPIAQVHWSLNQVNQLLFLRELARTGRFGPLDGEGPRPH